MERSNLNNMLETQGSHAGDANRERDVPSENDKKTAFVKKYEKKEKRTSTR